MIAILIVQALNSNVDWQKHWEIKKYIKCTENNHYKWSEYIITNWSKKHNSKHHIILKIKLI